LEYGIEAGEGGRREAAGSGRTVLNLEGGEVSAGANSAKATTDEGNGGDGGRH
jgi:hypothetical protein